MTPEQQRVLDRVAVTPDGCWIWTLATNEHGYGVINVPKDGINWKRQHTRLAHRYAYMAFRGGIPGDKVLDHVVCDQPPCANPWHVEPRTQKENTLRSLTSPAATKARQTHCIHGHAFTPENIYRDRLGNRRCRECNRIRARLNHARKRALRV